MPDDVRTQQIIPARPRPRQMMIKNLMPRLPERGKIKIGAKGQMVRSRQGANFQPPVKLDHFRVTTLERGADGNFLRDEEFHRRFGDRPTEIPIRLLYDKPELNFQTRYACFLGRTLWCSGDGATAIRLSEDAPRSRQELEHLQPRPQEVECPCFRQEPSYQGRDKCKMNGNLSVIIEGASGLGGVWNFRTTSYNSIVGIMSSMAFIRSVTGGPLANIPLKLRVQRKQATAPTDGSQVTIFVVGLEFEGNVERLQQIGHQIALDRATTHISIKEIETEARRRLALAPPGVPLPGDDADDVVEEFYPEQAMVDEPPPRPRPEDFVDDIGPAATEEPEPFRVVDLVGDTLEFDDGAAVVPYFRQVLDEAERQKGDLGVEAIWESNARLIYDLRERGQGAIADELAAYYSERLAKAAQHDIRSEVPERAAVVDPRTKPPEAADGEHADDGAGSRSETKVRQSASADGRRSGARGEDDGQTRASAVEAGGSPAPQSLTVPLRQGAGNRPDWEGTAQDMVAKIAELTDPADTASDGRFKRDNREHLEEMRSGNRNAWSTVEYRLGDRDRQLRQGAA